jgi:hypothetical protein
VPLEVESDISKLQAGWLVPALDQFGKHRFSFAFSTRHEESLSHEYVKSKP